MPCKRGKAKPIPKELRALAVRDDLRGLSFRGKDLSDANFSKMNLRGVDFSKAILRRAKFINADIRGANFSHAFLEEADFEGAEAGYTQAWTTFAAIVWIPLSIWIFSTVGIINVAVLSFFAYSLRIFAVFLQSIRSFNFFSQSIRASAYSIREGFYLATKDVFTKKFLLDLCTFGIFNFLFLGYSHEKKAEFYSINTFENLDGRKSRIFTFSIPIFCVFLFYPISNFNFFGATLKPSLENGNISLVITYPFIASLAFVISLVLTAALYNDLLCVHTTFKGANLRKAKFDEAYLPRTNFRKALLYQTSWRSCFIRDYSFISSLEFGFLPFSTGNYLEDINLMEVLVKADGKENIFDGRDLSFINLSSCDLSRASFIETDLQGADLQNAILSGAKLICTSLINADLSGATLTGACIQDWHINAETKFDGVKCDYIFLDDDLTPESRRPLVGNFADGDFEKVYKTFGDTLDFLFHRGSDPVAFCAALTQLRQNNPSAKIKGWNELSDELLNVSVGGILQTAELEVAKTFRATESSVAEQRLQEALQRISFLEGENQTLYKWVDRERERSEQVPKLSEIIKEMKMTVNNEFNLGGANIQSFVGGNVEGDQTVTQNNHMSEQNFDVLFSDFSQFVKDLQTKHPNLNDETVITQTIDAEVKEMKGENQKRWQNFLNLKRLWNGGKKATLKMGEHLAEQNIWYKGAIAFLEGAIEDVK